MKYKVGCITIRELISLYDDGLLNLSPPYQRNAVWDKATKKLLIDSIKNNFPLPNIFLHQVSDNNYDMVDGQQRTRAILGYYNNVFYDNDGKWFSEIHAASFLEYIIPLVTITDIGGCQKIEDYYARVNSAGKKLNRPELLKAKFFETHFMDLIVKLNELPEYEGLNLFSESSQLRMNDLDFTAELTGLIKFGRTDKKLKIDDIFKKDLTVDECYAVGSTFEKIINKFVKLNNIFPLKKTRYKQRNDFYTLFDFLLNNENKPDELIIHIYMTLIFLGNDIVPSNEECEPLQQYAFHCVSQSNSKQARESRYQILNKLFLNVFPERSNELDDVMYFYGLSEEDLVDVCGFSMLNLDTLKDAVDSN